MSMTTTVEAPSITDGLDLDIQLLETPDMAADLLNVTDDGCGSSCPDACTTSRG